MAFINNHSIKIEIEKEILCAEDLVNQKIGKPNPADDGTKDGLKRIESESEIPAEYRDGGLPNGKPLTADIVSLPEKYNLSGPYLSKNYRGPKIKWHKRFVYRHAEIAALSDRKSQREAKL